MFRSSEEFKDSIISVSLESVIVIDSRGIIVECNPAAIELFGFSKEELIGKNLKSTIIPPKYVQAHDEGMAKYKITGQGPVINQRIQIEAIKKNKTIFPIELAVNPFPYKGETYFVSRMRDITELKNHENNTKLLIDELNHRVKNTLTIVLSMISQVSKSTDDRKTFIALIQDKIKSLASTYDILTSNYWSGASIKDVLEKEFHLFESKRFIMNGMDLTISPSGVIPLAMVIHELTTNAVKYGSLFNHTGIVEISWYVTETDLVLTWKEINGPKVTAPVKMGFGSKLIKTVIERQLEGVNSTEYLEDGVLVILKIPLYKIQKG